MMEELPSLLSRLEALENRSAFQEMTIQQLSEELYQLRLRLDRSEKQNREFSKRLQEMQDSPQGNLPANQKPPHW